MTALELLAPARNIEIGIAAIDCGADAVYIAGPAYGARKDAGNSLEDIARLCDYAHKFGARIFVTVNTIIYDNELRDCYNLMLALQKAGVDALIVQDPALLVLAGGGPDGNGPKVDIPLHASTQCAIRTPQKAVDLEQAGFSRVVLERQLSIADIKAIRAACQGEIEYFVHGALCVCYSGQCYLSEKLAGRSANRGACIQACRGRYDLTDASGKVLARDKALLSLKDLNLLDRLEELAAAGVCSFKIEGRLKNISYVKNVVAAYSKALDALVSRFPAQYCRAAAGRSVAGFESQLDKTFNRGYTQLYTDGVKGSWASMNAPKSMGEKIGKVLAVKPLPNGEVEISVSGKAVLANGDGFAFVSGGSVCGFRGDICRGNTIRCKHVDGLAPGTELYRNLSAAFEKEITAAPSKRVIDAAVTVSIAQLQSGGFSLSAKVRTSDGREAVADKVFADAPVANNRGRMAEMLAGQLSKSSGHYVFYAKLDVPADQALPLLGAAAINELRRELAASLDTMPCISAPLRNIGHKKDIKLTIFEPGYKTNIANKISAGIYGADIEAYELRHQAGAELMRSRYCVRNELGLCPRTSPKAGKAESLFLTGNGKPLELRFNCAVCEMSVIG